MSDFFLSNRVHGPGGFGASQGSWGQLAGSGAMPVQWGQRGQGPLEGFEDKLGASDGSENRLGGVSALKVSQKCMRPSKRDLGASQRGLRVI